MKYPSIRIEGAILSPDILDHLEDTLGQRPADFGLNASAKVKDDIGRAWADAQDYWRIFQRKLDTLKPGSPATTETRNLWITPLLGLLGYQLEYQAKGVELNGKTYAISHRITNRGHTPIHITGYREPAGLDRKPENATLRMSAHALVQEYLNLHDELYGLVTNGRILRLLRDSSRLVKLSYLEFDLDRIFTDGLFADFAVLYRLLHATRLPVSHDAAAESLIERYHQDSLDSGARIRDGLSKAVEQAIRDFANGFLAHPANNALRENITSGKLTADLYYQHLLRLIYRLLFLMVIEERGLVFPAGANTIQREIYERYYSLQRLRRLSEKRYLADRRRYDHWLSLLATFRLFEANGPGHKLGLAPLAGDLFNPQAMGPLGTSTLGNDILLGCLRALGLYQNPDTGQMIRVNYAALNVEEFGSVYEGLLEYDPVFLTTDKRVEFTFEQGDGRAATGSHYIPDDLVQPLIKHSLDYLIVDKLMAPNPEQALLELRVADVACGSGHILLAAARRIAAELAVVRTGEEQPSPSAFRTAVRDVIRECIYGVDLNPLAIELCKVALWLEAHNPGEPLNFLDHHIKCGNAIIGLARQEELNRGIPDEAFKTLPDDDKEVAAQLRKRNKSERQGARQLNWEQAREKDFTTLRTELAAIEQLPETTPEEIDLKKQRYWNYEHSYHHELMKLLEDIQVAQFFIPKQEDTRQEITTHDQYRGYLVGGVVPSAPAAMARELAIKKRFFHWFLEFPEIIERGGFDCILGNPPYLGGKKISGTYGDAFLSWLKSSFYPAGGLSDLVVYFLRRIFQITRPGGFCGIITTNTLSQGDSRAGGLQFVCEHGGEIVFANRSVRWPGQAVLEVSLIALRFGPWTKPRLLNGRTVDHISTLLQSDEDEKNPSRLVENEQKSFIGSVLLGTGFLVSPEQASLLISNDQKNEEVLFPYLSGADLNSDPEQRPSRWAINFFNWPVERAMQYPECFDIVRRLVHPQRETVKRDVYRNRWWQYAEKCENLYRTIKGKKRVLVVAQTSKTVAFALVPSHYVFAMMTVVFDYDSYADFAIFQSTFHNVWAWKYASTLKSDLRYVPTDIAQTFPRPITPAQDLFDQLEQIGERYHEHRHALMQRLWLGLTDLYNLFHIRDLTAVQVAKVSKKSNEEAEAGYQGILELRRLHRQLDKAIRDAYGWSDLDLGHDFHEVETLPENDRVRYTLSPTARKEILKRLLAENHRRAAAQALAVDTLTPAKKKHTRISAADEAHGDLFS